MARLPEFGAILGADRALERAAAKLVCDLTELLRLLRNAHRAAVELDEQHRPLGQRELRIGIAGAHLQFVEQFDPRHRYPGLDGLDRRVARRLDRGERTYTGCDRFGNAVELQRQLGNDAERPLRADEQARETYPAEDFFARCAVVITSPLASTIFSASTLSFMVP